MRTFGTFLAVGILALAAGCGGGSGGTNKNGRNSITGVCAKDTCTALDAFTKCVETACDAQIKAAYGSSYASGSFSGPCASFQTCTLACPCDATSTTCEDTCTQQYRAAGSACETAYNAVSACGQSAVMSGTCTYPAACPVNTSTDTSTSTLPNTSTLTTSSTATKTTTTTATAGSCAKLSACCPSIIALAGGGTTVQQCQAAFAVETDAACAQLLSTYGTAGICN